MSYYLHVNHLMLLLGTVIGAVVMEGFYVVFDRQSNRIGFADTTCPAVAQQFNRSHMSGPYQFSGLSAFKFWVYFRKNFQKSLKIISILVG